jgi:hypothetical protein
MVMDKCGIVEGSLYHPETTGALLCPMSGCPTDAQVTPRAGLDHWVSIIDWGYVRGLGSLARGGTGKVRGPATGYRPASMSRQYCLGDWIVASAMLGSGALQR